MIATSRYWACLARRDTAGRLWLDERAPVRYQDQPDHRYHQVRAGDTWWALAARYLDGVCARPDNLWWILCEFQPTPVLDPTLAIPPGSTVVIPSIRFVRTVVFGAEQRRAH
jgi:hypothetical protein